MKHTAGPWQCEPIEAQGVVAAPHGYWVASLKTAMQPREAKANARLIAAAPDMLYALQHAINYLDHSHACKSGIERANWLCTCGMVDVYDHIAGAIKKAGGVA